jgi:hypothetical protein
MPVFGFAVLWDPRHTHRLFRAAVREEAFRGLAPIRSCSINTHRSWLSALLHFVRDGALRFHAARRTNISNVHETIRNECALLCVHGAVTAGTLNDTRFLQTFLHKQPSR